MNEKETLEDFLNHFTGREKIMSFRVKCDEKVHTFYYLSEIKEEYPYFFDRYVANWEFDVYIRELSVTLEMKGKKQ